MVKALYIILYFSICGHVERAYNVYLLPSFPGVYLNEKTSDSQCFGSAISRTLVSHIKFINSFQTCKSAGKSCTVLTFMKRKCQICVLLLLIFIIYNMKYFLNFSTADMETHHFSVPFFL